MATKTITRQKQPEVRKIYSLIKDLQQQIEELKREKNEFIQLNITDGEAREKVVFFLKELKIKGYGKIDMLDISNNLRLPATQIEKIMEKLKSDEFIKEIN